MILIWNLNFRLFFDYIYYYTHFISKAEPTLPGSIALYLKSNYYVKLIELISILSGLRLNLYLNTKLHMFFHFVLIFINDTLTFVIQNFNKGIPLLFITRKRIRKLHIIEIWNIEKILKICSLF